VKQYKNSGGLQQKLDSADMSRLDFEPRLNLRNVVARRVMELATQECSTWNNKAMALAKDFWVSNLIKLGVKALSGQDQANVKADSCST
jgi:hypothetical protein